MLAFKYPILLHQWHLMHPKFVSIVERVDLVLWHGYLHENFMVITSLHRNDGGVHSFYRAGDVRVRVGGRSSAPFIQLERLQDLELRINHDWDYGDGVHKVALLHGKLYPEKQRHLRGEENLHLHIQVRDETERKGEW